MKRIQTSASTKLFRHRAATIEVIEHLRALGSEARLLCFGSSWGAEVAPFALALPDATIVAAEIDPTALEKCRAIYGDFKNVVPIESSWQSLGDFGGFHAINANAVLCKFPAAANTFDLEPQFSFAQFEDTLGRLNGLLGDDGRLVMHNANYLMEDAEFSEGFRPLFLEPTNMSPPDNFVGFFSRKCQKIIHIASHNEAPTVEVSREFAPDCLMTRRWVAKQINQGLFIKQPSSLNAERCMASEAVFDTKPTDYQTDLRFELTKLVGKQEAHDHRFYKVPLVRCPQVSEDRSHPSKLRLSTTLWWGDQLMAHPMHS